jgi:hypothetical protein
VDGVEANRADGFGERGAGGSHQSGSLFGAVLLAGRGQMEIITRSTADNYHGQFNFLFRDSALNAQNALAAEQAV